MTYTTETRLNLHLRSKHKQLVGKEERKYACNLESNECQEPSEEVPGDEIKAVEAQYDYTMIINFITDQGPELYALTVL